MCWGGGGGEGDVPRDCGAGCAEDSCQLFDEVRSVAAFLELLDDSRDDVIVDVVGIDLRGIFCARGRWWRVLVGGTTDVLRWLGKRNTFG